MAQKLRNDDLNAILLIEGDNITFHDLEEAEPQEYHISVRTVERLCDQSPHLSFVNAACLIGRIEQIRVLCNAKYLSQQKMTETMIVRALANILIGEEVRDIYEELADMKYHEIVEMCEATNPLTWFREFF